LGYCLRGWAYANSGKSGFPQAESELKEAIRLDSRCGAAYWGLGGIYKKTHRDDEAVAALGKVIELFPKNLRFYVVRAELYKRNGDQQRAAEDYATAKKLGYKEGQAPPPLPFDFDVEE
jgi:Flp pilus assembly protein TadD